MSNLNHGWTSTVKLLKEINTIVRLTSIGSPPEEYNLCIWLKLHRKSGLLMVMKKTRLLCRQGKIKEVLFMFNTIQLFKKVPFFDVRSITDP